MLSWIKLRPGCHFKNVKEKSFLIFGPEKALTSKFAPLPDDKQILDILKQLEGEFLSVKRVKEVFLSCPADAILFKFLCMGLFFQYKDAKDSLYSFFPKFYSPYLLEDGLEVKKEDSEKNSYLRKENGEWIIDAPSSPFFIKLDKGNVPIEKVEKSFLELMKLDFFNNQNQKIDFKDQLFFHETRRRADIPKGTAPGEVTVSRKELSPLYSEKEIALDLNRIPQIFRRNSYRGPGKLNLKQLSSLLESVFAKQASFNDPFLGSLDKRFYPSAGAGYELSPVVFAGDDVSGLEKGAYHLDGSQSRLVKLNLAAKEVDKVLDGAKNSWGSQNSRPPAVIQLGMNPLYYHQKYSQICLSLSFINAGVIFSEIYRMAHILDIGVCALGSTAGEIWYEQTKGEFVSIAEIAIAGVKD